MKYKKHIFICTNERKDNSRVSCGESHGLELVKEFKIQLKAKGLNVDIRAQKTGCFDICEYGPNIVIYPEGTFYGKVKVSDIPEIIEEHLINNRIVTRLAIDFTKKPEQHTS